jgi:hypothetical protein
MNRWARGRLPLSGAVCDGQALWVRLSGAAGVGSPFFRDHRALWRISLSPATPALALPGDRLIDWGGAQRWLKTDAGAEEVRRDAHRGVSGVPPEFAARLSAEDLGDLVTGDIPLGTVRRSNTPQSPGRPRTSASTSSAPASSDTTPAYRGLMPSLKQPGSRRPTPETGVMLWASLRAALVDHPYCWLSCPTGPARWTP